MACVLLTCCNDRIFLTTLLIPKIANSLNKLFFTRHQSIIIRYFDFLLIYFIQAYTPLISNIQLLSGLSALQSPFLFNRTSSPVVAWLVAADGAPGQAPPPRACARSSGPLPLARSGPGLRNACGNPPARACRSVAARSCRLR